MDYNVFQDIIIMQRLGKLLRCSKDQISALRTKLYAQSRYVTNTLYKLEQYIIEMARQENEKLPAEQMVHFFGADETDLFISREF